MFWLCTCVIIINITGFKSTILLLFFVPFFFWFLFLYFTVFFWVEYNSIFLHHSLVGLISFLYVSVVILHFTIYIFNIPQFYFKWYNTSCKIYDCYEIINSSAQFFELLSYFTSTYIRNLMTNFGEGNGTPLQSSCLENPMDGGGWWSVVHRVAKSRTQLSHFTFTFHFHTLEKEMATHSSVLAWRVPGMGEPGGLLSMGSHGVGHDWSNLAAAAAAWQTYYFIWPFNYFKAVL